MNSSNLHGPLARIERKLDRPQEREPVKDSCETHDLAWPVDTAEFTVRGWARHRRIRAAKKKSGRGPHSLRGIGREEWLRYRPDGLLPFVTSSGRESR
jgi:hypothetical protein